MKNKQFILILVAILTICMAYSLFVPVKEGATANSSDALNDALTKVEEILKGDLSLTPDDPVYLAYIKKNPCWIPGKGAQTVQGNTYNYVPLNGEKGSNPSVDNLPTVIKNLFLKIQNMLAFKSDNKDTYPYNTFYREIVLYTAYLINLNNYINTLKKDGNSAKELVKILNKYEFEYAEQKGRKFSIKIDEAIFYLNILLTKAYNSGKFASDKEADFVCNFYPFNSDKIGYLQRIIPELTDKFIELGFTSIPSSLEVISLYPLDHVGIKDFAATLPPTPKPLAPVPKPK
jgi:hypothetical protein